MSETAPDAGTGYQVLARKYRPQTFADLIGQDAIVQTLKNAFAADRIAQAFVMTGIRGTGKTTTARIIAKGLNCVGPDGNGGPTTEPCGVCEPCRAISEGRHVDVLEMDAASRTGVGDIREIIESVRYRAASARYKIYIIDEVHMLSTSAFNALLKTLEEPPAHVKFVFATTEIRKVPVTVLSRCQRFDLRRIEPEVMIAHLADIAGREGAVVAEDALGLMTRAAEGSVRDALSLLDQALSHAAGEVSADQVRAMIGLADRGRVMDLLELILEGNAAGALSELAAQYADGADAASVLRDLAEVTHWVSVVAITPDAASDPTVAPSERDRGQVLAEKVPMRFLARLWQMLLKAIEEVALAPNAMMAAEMAIIRMTHVADLPSPEELVRRLNDTPPTQPRSGNPAPAPAAQPNATPVGVATAAPRPSGGGTVALAVDPVEGLARYSTFGQVVDLIRANRDVRLLVEIERSVRLVSYSPGRITFEPGPGSERDLAQRLGARLQGWTGVRWTISVVSEGGAPTIDEDRSREEQALKAEAMEHPLVKSVIAAFPQAEITHIQTQEEIAAEAAGEALPEVEDEWDPFEET